MNENFQCPITGLNASKIDESSYSIKVNDENLFIKHGFRFETLINQEDFSKNKHIFAGAILNKQLSDRQSNDVYWFSITLDNYRNKLKEIIYPKSPKSKLENLFLSLYDMQKFDGEVVSILRIVSTPGFYYKQFFQSNEECLYYLKELDYQGLINCTINDADIAMDFTVTFKGLNYYLALTEEGNLSNKCFIAMSFDSSPSIKEIRETIRQALEINGFEPLIIDEQLIDSSQTINDAIIAAIKSSKFCIADFSQQKDGVYFESGFASGMGKPVIYSCHKNWFKKSHFDTNHFPHIIYASTDELLSSLDKKIKAWIK